jgi:hypothetical protein
MRYAPVRMWRHLLVFALVAAFSAPGFLSLTRRAFSLATLDPEARREVALGEPYRSIRDLDREIPAGEPLAVLLRGPGALDRGVFVNYYVYPRRSFNHFERQLPADAPRYLAVVEAEGPVRRTIVGKAEPDADAATRFLVPFVAAAQGNDAYATEAVFVAERAAEIRLTLMPDGISRTIRLDAATERTFGDVVYENFGTVVTGWLDVQASAPVRAGFWFVNRGRAVAAPVRIFSEASQRPVVAGGERLWVVNPAPEPVRARVNGREETLAARALVSFAAQPVNTVEAWPRGVVAFTTAKEADGNTTFRWPGGTE